VSQVRIASVAVLSVAILGFSGCVDPSTLDGLVVALPPSTPDNLNITPIIVVAPRAANVEYRYEWSTDNPDFSSVMDTGQMFGAIVGGWATRPGDTWTVRVVPYVGSFNSPIAEGPAFESTTQVTDAGRDSDNDGDGVTENQGDCDDTDVSVFPGVDQDGDGFPGCAFQFAGAQPVDCDDGDSQINPGRTFDGDSTRPMQDDDCDGLIDEDAVTDADFVITEVMAESDTLGGEWLEVNHLVDAPRQLLGWELGSPSGVTARLGAVLLDGAGLFVLCADPAVAQDLGVSCDNTAGFSADIFGAEGLRLAVPQTASGTVVVQEIVLDGLPGQAGASAQLSAGSTATPEAPAFHELWCVATSPFGSELGTPGTGNVECD